MTLLNNEKAARRNFLKLLGLGAPSLLLLPKLSFAARLFPPSEEGAEALISSLKNSTLKNAGVLSVVDDFFESHSYVIYTQGDATASPLFEVVDASEQELYFGLKKVRNIAMLSVSNRRDEARPSRCYYLPYEEEAFSGFKIKKEKEYAGSLTDIGLPVGQVILTSSLSGCSIFSFETKDYVYFLHSNIRDSSGLISVDSSKELFKKIRAHQPHQYGSAIANSSSTIIHDFASSTKEFNSTHYRADGLGTAIAFWCVQRNALGHRKLYLYYQKIDADGNVTDAGYAS